MRHGADTLRRLSSLLDEALVLDAPRRETWLAQLHADDADLATLLRKLLAQDTLGATAEFMPKLPIAAPQEAPSAGGVVGPYRLERALGRGGMGEVWLATRADGALRRSVALKLPHVSWAPGLSERFARERDILASLEHPNIARLYDAGIDQRGRPYMALEYVPGVRIDDYCRAHSLPMDARLRLLLQVADAVAFAHSRLVVHRDLKPGNILVTPDGQARLLDFGIAKMLEGDVAAETALTQAAGRALTIDYASPEQVRGDPIGTSSDVYSLGVVAFELLAGSHPYRLRDSTPARIEEAVMTADAPSASDVAPDLFSKRLLRGDLDAILNKALKKNPLERYPTVDAFAQDLRRRLAGEGVAARPDTLAYRASRFARRHRRPLAAGTAIATAFAIGLGLGATALVIATLAGGMSAAAWQARRAGIERDRAYALAERNSAVNVFLDTLLTKAARGGPLTAAQLLDRSERLVETEVEGNAGQHAYVLGLLASCHSQIDDASRARDLLARAVTIARDAGDDALLDSLSARHAVTVGRLGDHEGAIAVLEAILGRATTAPEVRAEAHAHRAYLANLGNDRERGLMHAREALRWHRAAPRAPRRQEPIYLAHLAWSHHLNAQNDDAVREFAASIAAFESLGLEDSAGCVQYMGNWGLAEQELGDLARSLELFDRCIAIQARTAPDAQQSPYVLANRAYTLAQMGRWDEALAGYRESLAVARQREMGLLAYNIALCMVELFADQERASDAMMMLEAAQADRPESIPAQSPADSARLRVEASISAIEGETAAAIAYQTESIGEGLPSAGVLVSLLGRARNHERDGNREAAEGDARAALAMANVLKGSRPWSFRTGLAHLQLARLLPGHEARAQARAALPHLVHNLDPAHPAMSQARALAG